ncbi:hypothetical protein ACFT0G_10970 [Streptomyces sp. NPDC057020]|uniref:hypothetical protein n=1 Tax=unclassified Streptomyces TaxID=2593676 RepID=UPI003627347E
MGKRLERKMLRLMAGGRPVALDAGSASLKKLARLTLLAEQFGYAYADLRQGGTSFTLYLVPDLRPRARELAAENWSRYPRATEEGPLPATDLETFALLRARMLSDLERRYRKEVLWLLCVPLVLAALDVGADFGDGWDSVLTIAAVTWAGTVVLMLPLHVWGRRTARKSAALLEAAGFTRVPDESGRLRYVPPANAARPR